MMKDILLGPNNLESSYKHESWLQIYVILYFYELQSTCLFHIILNEFPFQTIQQAQNLKNFQGLFSPTYIWH